MAMSLWLHFLGQPVVAHAADTGGGGSVWNSVWIADAIRSEVTGPDLGGGKLGRCPGAST